MKLYYQVAFKPSSSASRVAKLGYQGDCWRTPGGLSAQLAPAGRAELWSTQCCFGVWPAAVGPNVWTCPWRSSRCLCKGAQLLEGVNRVVLSPIHTIESPWELIKQILSPRKGDWRWNPNSGILRSVRSVTWFQHATQVESTELKQYMLQSLYLANF